jgi:hypothetical protein
LPRPSRREKVRLFDADRGEHGALIFAEKNYRVRNLSSALSGQSRGGFFVFGLFVGINRGAR